AEVSFLVVDGRGCVKARTNWYSTPLRAGTKARVNVLPAWLEVWHEGRCVARHERNYGRGRQVFNLEHYLEVLERKPGALAGSAAVRYLIMTDRDELAGKGDAPIRLEASDLGALIQYERPLPSVQEYDRLLV